MANPVEIVPGKTYQLWAKIKDPLTGKWRRETRMYHGGIRAARDAMATFRLEVKGQANGTKTGTVAYAMDVYLELLRSRKKAERYLDQSEFIAKAFADWCGPLTLNKLTVAHLDDFYHHLQRDLKRSANTVHHYHAFIRPALKLAVRNGWLDRNPAEQVELPSKGRHNLDIPSPPEVEKLLQIALDKESWPCFVFFCASVATSARRGELAGLRWSDVDLDRGTIMIEKAVAVLSAQELVLNNETKTGIERSISLLDDDFAQLLSEHRDWQETFASGCGTRLIKDPFVFSAEPDGSVPLHPNLISNTWRRVAKRGGIKCRLHDLRHFGATEALAAGVAPSMVSYRLGHQKMSTTLDIYGHHRPDLDVNMAKFMSETLKFPMRLSDKSAWPNDSTPPSDGSPSQ